MTETAHASGPVPILRMNGLGNKITVLDLRGAKFALSADTVRKIGDDPRTNFDQLMVLGDAGQPDTLARIKIYNIDGSAAGACGNGMRCVALAVWRETGQTVQVYETVAGLIHVQVAGPDDISVDMGQPRFGWEDIPLRDPFHDTTGIELQVGPIDDPVMHTPSVCNMGNPHAVFWVDDVDAINLERFGPLLEFHPLFPEQANISIAQVLSAEHARIVTWERGVGITQACGSAACAVLVCGVRLGYLQRTATITVPGGDLKITWNDRDRVLMTGPAACEAAGTVSVAAGGAVLIDMPDTL